MQSSPLCFPQGERGGPAARAASPKGFVVGEAAHKGSQRDLRVWLNPTVSSSSGVPTRTMPCL